MDIDEIFKRPPLPKGSTKRKFEMPTPELPPSDQPPVKVAKTTGGATIKEDTGSDEDDENDDLPGGEFAPNGDADYFAEEDEDGRFFGGGLNDTQKEIMNLMEGGEANATGDLSPQGIKKQLLAFEKAINKNRNMRTKHSNEPEKFVDSEFVLTEALNALLLLSSSPSIAYPLLVELSTPSSLSDLLSHENPDVVIAVIEVLEEWTDEEVLEVDEEDEEEGEDEGEKRRVAMTGLVDALVEAGVVEMVVSGLERLNEEDESERGGVYHTLGLIENLVNLLPTIATSILSPKSGFIKFLVTRLGADKLGPDFDQNRFYAGELLSVLLALTVDGVQEARERIATEGFVDVLLKCLAVYRRRDPHSADEVEFMENLFDSLCSALSSPVVQAAFLEGEGTELMCLMLKEKKLSRTRAIKTLDYALQGPAGVESCEKFVEMLGLKTLFSVFMGKGTAKKGKAAPTTHEDMEHILSLLSSLFTSLASESESRIRLLAKFVEGDYEKVDRLLELREDVEARVDAPLADAEDLDEDEVYIEKLDRGLFSLQLIDYIIAWLCMEDDGVRDHIKMLLSRKGRSYTDVVKVLSEYRDNLGDGPEAALENGKEAEEEREPTRGEQQRDILIHLISYLEGL